MKKIWLHRNSKMDVLAAFPTEELARKALDQASLGVRVGFVQFFTSMEEFQEVALRTIRQTALDKLSKEERQAWGLPEEVGEEEEFLRGGLYAPGTK
jgi:hypothetical protein